MNAIKITDSISFFPGSVNPLSAEVYAVKTPTGVWVYDVGNSEEALGFVNSLGHDIRAAVSHFHSDHAGNIENINCRAIYGGAYTRKKFNRCEPIVKPTSFDGSVTLFPIPSSHSKGCLGLMYGDCALLGDAVYGGIFNGRPGYSAGALRCTIDVISELEVKFLLISHEGERIREKEDIVTQLKNIYRRRASGENYIKSENIT